MSEDVRHTPHFEFVEACGKPGCPVCALVDGRTWRWMDNLLFEHVSDRPFRAAFRAAGGFCAEHAAKLTSYRDGLAVAILHRDILADRLGELESKRRFKPKAACPACVQRESIEANYLSLVADARDDGQGGRGREILDALEKAGGLCLPHYSRLALDHRCVSGRPRDYHEQKFKKLLSRVDVFLELSAYGKQDGFARLSAEDKVVWKELIEAVRKKA